MAVEGGGEGEKRTRKECQLVLEDRVGERIMDGRFGSAHYITAQL